MSQRISLTSGHNNCQRKTFPQDRRPERCILGKSEALTIDFLFGMMISPCYGSFSRILYRSDLEVS